MNKKGPKKAINQWTKEYKQEPLKTYKEIIALAQEGINRYVIQEVNKGRTYKSVGDELGMTRSNIEKIVNKKNKGLKSQDISTVDR